MLEFVKTSEYRTTHYLVYLDKSFDDYSAYLDATSIIQDAIHHDRRLGYEYEDGPNYAIEKQRAEDYAQFVAVTAQASNYYKFDTKNYQIRVSAVSDSQLDANRRSSTR
jgi:hypothetical protein